MNMGMAEQQWQDNLERLHKESIHDDGCETMFPGGKCNCTQSSIRTGQSFPVIPLPLATKAPKRNFLQRTLDRL